MQVSRKGFATFVLEENPNVLVVHCMIHKEALVFRSLPKDLMLALDQVITIVKLHQIPIACIPTFLQFFEAIDSDYKSLPWKSRISKGVCDCYPAYSEYASNKEIILGILYALTRLQSALQHYFPTVASNEYE